MSARRGSQTPMLRLDRDTAERLLSGRVAPDDAPPGYADVARVVLALGEPATDAELRGLDEAVAAAARLATTGAPAAGAATRRPRRSRRARVKVVALAVLGAMVVTSGLAMAGVLPHAAQDLVSDVFSKVGIRVPPAGAEAGSGDAEAGGHAPAPHSPVDVLPSPGIVDPVRPSSAPPPDAPATSPNGSGTGHADEASGGKSEQGTTIADDRSDGRSAAGGGNSERRGNGSAGGQENGSPGGQGNGASGGQGNGASADRGNDPPPRGEHGGPPHANRP